MSYVKTDNKHYSDIADAIRFKTGGQKQYYPSEMAEAIAEIEGSGVEPAYFTWQNVTDPVKNFLESVTYDPTDYTVSSIEDYAPATPNVANYKPIGQSIYMGASGQVVRGEYKEQVNAGNAILYNDIPNKWTPYLLLSGYNAVLQGGGLKPNFFLRWIRCPYAWNVRDMGGWACDGGTIKYGRLIRGSEISANDRDVLVNQCGVRFEMNLRGINESGRTESILGSDIGYAIYDSCANYTIANKTLMKQMLRTVFDCVIGDVPMYFHCHAGADRTGTLACVIAGILGVSQSDIDKDYELTSFYSGTSDDEHARRRNESLWIGLINEINAYSGATFRDKCVRFALELGFSIDEINAFRQHLIDGTPQTLSANVQTFTVTKTLTHAAVSNSAQTATQFQPFDTDVTPDSGYVLSNVVVTMGGANITDKVFSGIPTVRYCTVSKHLTNCSINNSKKTVVGNEGYVATISPNEGYELSSVQVTMGGVNVTASFYSSGKIAIPQVTGNIVITATAVESAEVITNLVDSIGIAPNVRVSLSTGENAEASGFAAVGATKDVNSLIHFSAGDVIRVRGFQFPQASDGKSLMAFYDSTATRTGGGYIYKDHTSYNAITAVWESDGSVTLTASAETYIRFDAPCSDTSAVVITRNQPLPSE